MQNDPWFHVKTVTVNLIGFDFDPPCVYVSVCVYV